MQGLTARCACGPILCALGGVCEFVFKSKIDCAVCPGWGFLRLILGIYFCFQVAALFLPQLASTEPVGLRCMSIIN